MRLRSLLLLVAALAAGSAMTASVASATYQANYCDQVLIDTGHTCFHGASHSDIQDIYGRSTGSALARVGTSSSGSTPIADTFPPAYSPCGGCSAEIYVGPSGHLSGYPYIHNHSTFLSRFTGCFSDWGC